MALEAEMNAVMEALGLNASKAMDIEHQKGALSSEIVTGMQSAIPAAVSVSQQKGRGELAAQENAIAVRQALGNDINDPDSLMAMMVQDFRETSIAARQQQMAIAQKQQVGLFDDPLQYMVNYVTLPDEKNALAATQGRADMAAQTIQNMQALTTASAQAQKATAQTMTKQSVLDQAQVQTAELNAKIAALKIDSLGYDSNAIKIADDQNAQMMQLKMNQHSMMLQDAAAARASEMHKLQVAKIKEADLDDSQYASIIGVGAAAYGQRAPDLASIKLMMKSPNQKAILDAWFEQGMATGSTGSVSVGATPGQAILNTLSTGGLQDAQNKPARDYLQSVAKEAREVYETKNGKITKFTPDIRNAIAAQTDDLLFGPVNPKTGKRIETQGKLYKMAQNPDAPGSLLKAPDLPQLIQISAVQTNPLYNLVLKPAVDSGIKEASPNQVYKMASAARDKGLISNQQMVMALSELYTSVAVNTYASKGLSKFMLPYSPTYNAAGDKTLATMITGNTTVNWTDPASILSYDIALNAGKAYSKQDMGMAFGQKPQAQAPR